jgi:hypothetical protein
MVSVYRFMCQNVPVVVLCEVVFEELAPVNARKLFMVITWEKMKLRWC